DRPAEPGRGIGLGAAGHAHHADHEPDRQRDQGHGRQALQIENGGAGVARAQCAGLAGHALLLQLGLQCRTGRRARHADDVVVAVVAVVVIAVVVIAVVVIAVVSGSIRRAAGILAAVAFSILRVVRWCILLLFLLVTHAMLL